MFLPKKTRTLMSQRKGEAKLRDRVKVYLRHIRQPQNQQLEAKGYLQFRDNFGSFLCSNYIQKIQI